MILARGGKTEGETTKELGRFRKSDLGRARFFRGGPLAEKRGKRGQGEKKRQNEGSDASFGLSHEKDLA